MKKRVQPIDTLLADVIADQQRVADILAELAAEPINLSKLIDEMPDLSTLFTDDDMAALAELSASVAEPGEPQPVYFDIDDLLNPDTPPRRRKPRQQRRRAR